MFRRQQPVIELLRLESCVEAYLLGPRPAGIGFVMYEYCGLCVRQWPLCTASVYENCGLCVRFLLKPPVGQVLPFIVGAFDVICGSH